MRPKLNLRKTRPVYLIIATATVTALAAAATGVAAADSGPAPPGVELDGWPRHVTYGRPTTIAGQGQPAQAGMPVALQEAIGPGGSWSAVAAGTVGSDGRFALRTRVRRSGLIRAVVLSAPAPGGGSRAPTAQAAGSPLPGAVSAPRRLSVKAALRVSRRPRAVLGRPLTVGGRLLPARAGRVIRLQARERGVWRTLGRARTGRAGGFRLRSMTVSGVLRPLRVVFGGDRLNGAASRSAGTVTVYSQAVASWYDDAGTTACGFHAVLGVASPSLPCGTRVRFRHGSRSVTAVVDDRGPYVGGRTWDLDQSTASALGFSGVGTVWAAY